MTIEHDPTNIEPTDDPTDGDIFQIDELTFAEHDGTGEPPMFNVVTFDEHGQPVSQRYDADALPSVIAELFGPPKAETEQERQLRAHQDRMGEIEDTVRAVLQRVIELDGKSTEPQHSVTEAATLFNGVQETTEGVGRHEGEVRALLDAEGISFAELFAYAVHVTAGLDEMWTMHEETIRERNSWHALANVLRRDVLHLAMNVMYWRSLALHAAVNALEEFRSERQAYATTAEELTAESSAHDVLDVIAEGILGSPLYERITADGRDDHTAPPLMLAALTFTRLRLGSHIACRHDLIGRWGASILNGDWEGATRLGGDVEQSVKDQYAAFGVPEAALDRIPPMPLSLAAHWSQLMQMPGLAEYHGIDPDAECPFPDDSGVLAEFYSARGHESDD